MSTVVDLVISDYVDQLIKITSKLTKISPRFHKRITQTGLIRFRADISKVIWNSFIINKQIDINLLTDVVIKNLSQLAALHFSFHKLNKNQFTLNN